VIKTLKKNKFNITNASILDCIHLQFEDPYTAQKLINKTFSDIVVVQNDGLHLHCEKFSPLKMNTILSTLIKAEIFPMSFCSPHYEGYSFSVQGMNCGGCVKKISTALKESFGDKITNVFVSLEMNKCMVIVKDRKVSKEELKGKIQEIGFECTEYKLQSEKCCEKDSCCEDESCSKPCCKSGKCAEQKNEEKTCKDTCCDKIRDSTFEKVELLSIKIAKEELKSLVLLVEGMTCTSCASKLEKTINCINGVHSCSVNFLSKKCEVVYDEDAVNEEKIIKSVKKLGFTAEIFQNLDGDGKVQLLIDEIKTDRKLVESKLLKHTEILQYEIDESQGSVTIEFDASVTYKRAIIDKLAQDGLYVSLKKNDSLSMLKASLLGGDEQRKYRNYFLFCLGKMIESHTDSIVFTFPMLLISVILEHIPIIEKYLSIRIFPTFNLSVHSVIMLVLATPVQFVGAYPFYTTAFKALRNFALDMDILVVIATFEAYLYSLFIVIYGIFVTSITGITMNEN
jgi:copper ion binding protein